MTYMQVKEAGDYFRIPNPHNPHVPLHQCSKVFQVSHSVSSSSAPYRLNDALARNISGLESVLLLRRNKRH